MLSFAFSGRGLPHLTAALWESGADSTAFHQLIALKANLR